jgi:hypothetical protein
VGKGGGAIPSAGYAANTLTHRHKKRDGPKTVPEACIRPANRAGAVLEHFPITSHHILRRRDSFGIRLG